MKIPQGNGVVTNRVTSTGNVTLDASRMAASSFSGALDIVDQHLDQRAEKEAQDARNLLIQKKNDLAQKFSSAEGEAALGATQKGLSEYAALEQEITSKLGKRAKTKLGDFTTRLGEDFRMGLISHEKKEEHKSKVSTYENGITLSREMIRKDAKSWKNAVEHMGQTFEMGLKAGLIKPEEAETKRTELTNQFRTEIGKSYYTQDKHDFMKNIDQFGFGKPEIEAYKAKYQNDLAAEEREKKSLFSEEAKLLYGKRDDMLAQATANGDTSHLSENAVKLEKMGFKDWANTLREDASLYEKVISFNDENKNKPLGEILQAARSLSVPEGLDGSSVELKSIQAIQKETLKSAKIFDTDPAEYVSKWAQGGTMEEIASSRLSLQESQGLFPSKGFQFLTASEKKNFKGAWEAGDMKQKTDLVLNSFRYGKHTPKILDEVGVNSSLSIAPMLSDEKDIELLVAGISTKPEILDDTMKADYAAAAKGSDFYNTLLKVQAKFPTNPDLPQKIKDIENAMTGIGARMVDPQAGAKFFDEKIKTLDADDKLVYFPQTVDEDEVEDALNKKKDEIVNRFKTGDSSRDLSAKWAIRDAVWVNTSSGFALVDNRSGAYLPGSEMDMLELDTIRKDLVKAKTSKANDLVTQTFMRR